MNARIADSPLAHSHPTNKARKSLVDNGMTHQPPAPYNVPAVLHGTRFLVNGKLESWTGPSSEVRSPILSEDEHGSERTLLGSVPDLPAEEGIRALEAACDAYDHGRGVWPSSSASDRIEAMEKFIKLIEPKRDQVAELLMLSLIHI